MPTKSKAKKVNRKEAKLLNGVVASLEKMYGAAQLLDVAISNLSTDNEDYCWLFKKEIDKEADAKEGTNTPHSDFDELLGVAQHECSAVKTLLHTVAEKLAAGLDKRGLTEKVDRAYERGTTKFNKDYRGTEY